MRAALPLLVRTGAFAAALLMALAGAAPALAQITSDIPPPGRYLIDENGIDVARGEHLLTITDLSIGPQGEGGLAYVRQLRRSGGGHPYDLGLFQSGNIWTASVGLTSYQFSQSGSIYTSIDGKGATLVQNGANRTLTTPDGTVVVYDYDVIATGDFNRKSRATSITHPNGNIVNLHWISTEYCVGGEPDTCYGGTITTAVRLQAVSSPLGYQLYFNYARNLPVFQPSQVADWKRLLSITALNTTVESCNPEAPPCSPTGTWPTASYSGSSVTDPAGRTSSYVSTATSFTVHRPGGSTIVYNYNSSGHITSVVRDGMTWTYGYSVPSNLVTLTMTDPGGHVRTTVSDTNVGLPTSVTNEVGKTTSYTYDPAGRLIRMTADDGNYVHYTYDARGNVTQTQAVPRPGSGSSTITTSAVYPATCGDPQSCNRPTSTTDGRGAATDYTYSTVHGGVLTATAPAGANGVRPQTRYTYTALLTPGGATVHRVTNISTCQTLASCDGAADETETVVAYAHPNLLRTSLTRRDGTGSLSATQSFGYDGVGNLLTVDGPLSGTADTRRTRYNLAREVTGTVSPDPDGTGALEPRAQRITRNATTGLVTRIETGTVDSQSDADWATFAMLERVDIAHDSSLRPVQQTLTGADLVVRALTRMSYDNEGRPFCTATRMNPNEFGTPLANACALDTTSTEYGPDRITRTTYDAANRPNLVQTGYLTAAASTEVATAYTDNGQILHVTDGNGNRTTYEYDGHDRLLNIRFPSPTTDGVSAPTSGPDADFEQLTLDANGNVTNRRLRDGQSIAFSYDALNRLTQKDPSAAGELSVTYSYDNLGRMTGASQTGQALTFTYDALGRNLTQSGPHGTTAYQYDLSGRRTLLDYPGTGLFINYSYLVTGEVTMIRENGATSGIGLLATFGYDQLGRRTSLTRGNGTTTTYGYDAVSRLASLVQGVAGTTYDLTLGFTYNPASQIATATRSNDEFSYADHVDQAATDTHNGRNELLTTGGTGLGYDGRHNIAMIGGTTYAYSSENRLVSGGTVTLSYDPLGRLYQASTARWAYDGPQMISEYNLSNALTRRFVHGPGVNEPLVWYEGSGLTVRRFLHADERGSIIAVSDSTGAVIGTNRYDEYGVPTSATMGRFQYTGQVWIASIGMYYYRARFYHPGVGRFMQTDPIGYGSGMNLYAYVLNDPVNFTDPHGLNGCGLPNTAPPSVCGVGGIDHPGGGGGRPPNASPNALINEDLNKICERVRKNGNNIEIGTPVEFYYGDYPTTDTSGLQTASSADANYYLDLFNNGRWNNEIGRFSVDVNMVRESGGFPILLGNPAMAQGSNGGELAGPDIMYFALPTNRSTDSIYADHALGHAFGNPHDPAIDLRLPGNIMFHNPMSAYPRDVLEPHVESLIALCRLEG